MFNKTIKQYTTPEQTAKLIELGFERPRYECLDKTLRGIEKWDNIQCNYSIGELLELLPPIIESEDSEYATIILYFDAFNWIIEYTGVETTLYVVSNVELIDAIYDMILKLREDGLI